MMKKKIVSLLLAVALLLAIVPMSALATDTVTVLTTAPEKANAPQASEPSPFTDILNHWARPYIDWIYEQKIFNGTSPTEFSPDDNMTRGMAVTVLYRAAERPAVDGKNPFIDVQDGRYFTIPIIWAVETGVAQGTSDITFSPNLDITREQFAVMLYNFDKNRGGDPDMRGDLSIFHDQQEISSWARTALSWAVGKGYMEGKGNGILDPKGTATRAEIAKILCYCVG